MLKLIVKCWANRCVLRARRKAGWKSMVRMVAGKLFHMPGSATKKARLPNCVLLRLTAAARVVEERSWRTFESAEANTIRSERYDGHRRWKVWCMIVAILKVTRYLTGSQCSFWSTVVMCDLQSSPSARWAAALCACWRGAEYELSYYHHHHHHFSKCIPPQFTPRSAAFTASYAVCKQKKSQVLFSIASSNHK